MPGHECKPSYSARGWMHFEIQLLWKRNKKLLRDKVDGKILYIMEVYDKLGELFNTLVQLKRFTNIWYFSMN